MPTVPPRGWLFAAGLGFLFTAVTTAITWAEHITYNSTSLDMAVYTQLLWNTANGSPFATTLLLENRVHLAEHLGLLLLPLAPLYGLAPDPKLLLLLQQSALGLSGLSVFWLARRRLSEGAALGLTAAYYLMPTLAEVALDAFYPIVFAAVPIGWAAALSVAGARRMAVLPVLLALLWEEEAALPALGIGIFLLLFRPNARRPAAGLAIASLVWLGLAEAVVMPSFQQPNADTRVEGHFGRLRASPAEWLGSVALARLDPELVRQLPLPGASRSVPQCSQPGQCSAARWWIYPTAGLALGSPSTLIMAVPLAAALLLADRPGRFRRHWAAPMLPIIWVAAAVALARATRRTRLMLVWSAALSVATLLFYRLDSPLPLGAQYEAGDVLPTPSSADLQRLSEGVPTQASVMASRRVLAHLANRVELYVFPPDDYAPGLWPPPSSPGYALLDLRNADTARELTSPDSPTRGYRQISATQNAMLLARE